MKILMLAPEPFFQPRGTPISVYFRLRALSDLGHEVDLVTYHLGEDKSFDGLTIHRIPSLFFIKKIRVGPSPVKVLLDFLLFFKARRLLRSKTYQMIFSHEEASWMGTALAKRKRIPHLYDMHSSLPQQLENFRFSRSRIIKNIFSSLERYVLQNSDSVIVICPDLLQKLERDGLAYKATLIENFLDFDHPSYTAEQIVKERQRYAPSREKIILYAGNFEPYQGVGLLLEAAASLKEKPVVLLLVGGNPEHVEAMKKKAAVLGIPDKVFFTGQVPPSQVPKYIMMADVLVSPRISGTNTPLKIYSFLKSGKPLVATNLWTHTQVLNDRISVLVEPQPQSLAEGILFALFDPQAIQKAQAAKKVADREFTFGNYKKKISQALERAIHHQEKGTGQQQFPNP
jgi:glycosyltransferase involved in cell wall biosynthesis